MLFTHLRILEKVTRAEEFILTEYKVSFGEVEAIPAVDGDDCPT